MSNIKNWMKIINEGADSFDSDHSAENLVNYYDDEDRSPESGETMDFEFGDKLAIEGIIDTYNENECVINIDPQAMAMLEDLKVIDTVEGYEVLPRLDRDKYQERDGLEGPIMTRSGKVVYYDPQKGDYYDPNTDMYIDYEDFKALDRKAITAEGHADESINEDEYEPHMMYKGSKKEYRAFKPKSKKHHDRLMKTGYDHDDPETKKKEEGYAGGDYASQDEVDEIADSIKSRFMNSPEIFSKVIKATSIDKFLDAIDGVAEFNAPMEEIGSSDMAALMKEVISDLGLDPKEIYANESIEEAEEHTYTVVHAKHGKEEIKASSSYGAAKKYAEMKKLKGTAGVDAHLHTKEDTVNENSIMDPETKKMIPEKDYVMKYIMSKHPEETKKLLQSEDLMDIYGGDLYNALFDYMSEEMPYGTQKGRDGDPVEYMQDELDSMGMFGEPTSQFDIYNMPSESVEENNTARLKRELDFDPDKVRSFINNLAKKQKTSELSDKEKQDFADAQELLADLSADLDEAKYQGKTVKLNKPIRTGTDEPKKFKVYVKDGDKVKMVRFGHQGGGKNKDAKTMRIKKSDPKRRKSFRARHNCKSPGPKTKARYWSCRMW